MFEVLRPVNTTNVAETLLERGMVSHYNTVHTVKPPFPQHLAAGYMVSTRGVRLHMVWRSYTLPTMPCSRL